MGDIEIDQRYYNRIKKMVTNPTVEVWMILPEAVFLSYNFDRFIYLKHKDLQGYFYVEKIGNYKDGVTPVRLDLLYVD
jgi:hypothetical protein